MSRPTRIERGYCEEWIKLRRDLVRQRREYCERHNMALCEDCAREGRKYDPEQRVDGAHDVPVRICREMRLQPDNVELLCRKHHKRSEHTSRRLCLHNEVTECVAKVRDSLRRLIKRHDVELVYSDTALQVAVGDELHTVGYFRRKRAA